MATEHPRQHVWAGDSGVQLTYLVSVGELVISEPTFYLTKSLSPSTAILAAVHASSPISDEWENLVVVCRPLHESEVIKVTLNDGEVIELDDESYERLTT